MSLRFNTYLSVGPCGKTKRNLVHQEYAHMHTNARHAMNYGDMIEYL